MHIQLPDNTIEAQKAIVTIAEAALESHARTESMPYLSESPGIFALESMDLGGAAWVREVSDMRILITRLLEHFHGLT